MGSKHKRRFQVRDLAKLLGTTPRRIEGWVEQDLLKPVVRGRGPGRRRQFDEDNLLQGALLQELQWTFGEKSPVWRKAFPDVAKAVVGISKRQDPEKHVILVVVQSDGEVDEVAVLIPDETLSKYIIKQMAEGRTITIVDVDHVVWKIRGRLKEWEG